MKSAFSYLRLSSKNQCKGDGYTRQREAINAFAKKEGYRIEQEFKDGGVSGTKDEFDRKGFQELMIALKANGIRTVIIENVNRLAREFAVQEIILRDCKKHNITILDASGTNLAIENDDPTRNLVRQILGIIAEYDKCLIVQKLAASRRRLRNQGKKCEGAKSYSEKKHPAVSRVVELRAQGISFQKIADTLNAEGLKPLRGIKFRPNQIQRIFWRLSKINK